MHGGAHKLIVAQTVDTLVEEDRALGRAPVNVQQELRCLSEQHPVIYYTKSMAE
jgi:hypothetical protein